jgi:N-acetylglucosamine-6-phosphate deacetylase
VPTRRVTALTALAVNRLPSPHFAPCTVGFGQHINSVEWHRSAKKTDGYLLPGFIDLQVIGACGIDVMAATAGDLLELAHCVAHDGTTAWMPTVITAPLEQIDRADAVIHEAMSAQAVAADRGLPRAAILGLHLEGPFISPLRRGAHPALNLLPTGEALERILRLRSLRMITLAPELEGALEAIQRFVARGVIVALGHSDATYEQAVAAVQAGATAVTHTFNAMRPLHHREPGLIGAALSDPKIYPAVIADGVHVHPAALSLVCRSPRAFLVSDRVTPAGTDLAAPMPLFGGQIDSARIADGAARLADGTLAGAIATIGDGLRLVINHAAIDPPAVERLSSGAAAELIGLRDRGRVEPRARADLILLDRDWRLKAVFVGGRELN